jgi:hypothetical protein
LPFIAFESPARDSPILSANWKFGKITVEFNEPNPANRE